MSCARLKIAVDVLCFEPVFKKINVTIDKNMQYNALLDSLAVHLDAHICMAYRRPFYVCI